ncbi:MAG: RNA polymerase subunit sigma-70, partial [Mesorhizobium sp.]
MDDRSEIARAAAEAAARRSYGKLVAWLAARTRDVAGAPPRATRLPAAPARRRRRA